METVMEQFQRRPKIIQDQLRGYAIAMMLTAAALSVNEFVIGMIVSNILGAAAFDACRGKEIVPGSTVQSDDSLRQFIRDKAESIYHPVGTCKMGNDPLAVVDDRLRVHGLSGLRVVDASIMPLLVGGNTNAPTVMIAEKAADMIKAEYAH